MESIRSALLGWNPLLGGAIEGIARRALERLLGRVHDQVAFAILVGQLERIEWNRHILLTHAEAG